MDYFNLSNLTPIGGVIEKSPYDVIKNFCTQIDDKIVLCCMLIYTFWFINNVILPRSLPVIEGWIASFSPGLVNDFKVCSKLLVSFLETGSLFGGFFLIAICVIQGNFSVFYWVWLILLLSVLGLTSVVELVAYLRLKFGHKET